MNNQEIALFITIFLFLVALCVIVAQGREIKKWKEPLADGEFDIERMDVFSIERQNGETVIGYVWTSGSECKVKQWLMPVTLEAHGHFLRRFRNKIQRRNGGEK